jgi:hypothetical protein
LNSLQSNAQAETAGATGRNSGTAGVHPTPCSTESSVHAFEVTSNTVTPALVTPAQTPRATPRHTPAHHRDRGTSNSAAAAAVGNASSSSGAAATPRKGSGGAAAAAAVAAAAAGSLSCYVNT